MEIKELLQSLHLSNFIAFDFETTGLDPGRDKIIEVAAIKFIDGKVSDRYVELINPQIDIPNHITEITGISNSMVVSSPKEEEIVGELISFIGEMPLVAHNIHFDIKFLSQLSNLAGSEEIKNAQYDTLQLARSVLFDQPVFNLSALSDYFELSSDGAHRAENDAENTGFIFLELLKEVSRYPLEIISNVNSMIKGSKIPNQKLYVDLGNVLAKLGDMSSGLNAFDESKSLGSNTYRHNGNNHIQDISSEIVFGVNGQLSNSHPNFENRPNQERYAKLVDDIINDRKTKAVIEAGTGLGKSMAYLFGGIKHSENFENDGPTIIACYTKHLQDQLFHKDLPMLAEAMDVPIKAVLLKGRKNYLCKTRFNWLLADAKTLDMNDLEALIPIHFWLYWTKTGDLGECSGFFNSRRMWLSSLISSEAGFCTSPICNRTDGCFYGKLKKAIYKAELIVVNHSLLMTNIIQKGLLPEHNAVIIDEAHNLMKSAYDQFKVVWDENQVLYQLQSIDPSYPRSARWNNIIESLKEMNSEIGEDRDHLKDAVHEAKSFLKKMMEGLAQENENRFSESSVYQNQPIFGNISKAHAPIELELRGMKQALENIILKLTKIEKIILEIDSKKLDYPILHTAVERGLEVVNGLIGTLIMLTENQDMGWVYWMEGIYKRQSGSNRNNLIVSLYASPIDISYTLRNEFFEKINTCVLTSATLKIQERFEYYLRRIGLDDIGDVVTKEFYSPFHYNEQVTYYQYGGSREISNSPEGIGQVVLHLHKTFNNRIMVLFTSINTLTDTAKYIRSRPEGRSLPLFAQFRGASRPSIIKGMHQKSNGILFGTNSFWEGVDFPGNLLETLVLVKLPFDVPSEPLVKSYSAFVNKMGGNSFIDYSLPEATIKFRQGFGRLIRTSYDSGKFICLDNRVVLKRYGRIISDAIPAEMITFSQLDSLK